MRVRILQYITGRWVSYPRICSLERVLFGKCSIHEHWSDCKDVCMSFPGHSDVANCGESCSVLWLWEYITYS